MGKGRLSYKFNKRNKKSKARKREWQNRNKLKEEKREEYRENVHHDHNYFHKDVNSRISIEPPNPVANPTSHDIDVQSKSVALDHDYDGNGLGNKSPQDLSLEATPGTETIQAHPESDSLEVLHEFSFIDKEDVLLHEMEVEIHPKPSIITGHRIVDLQHVLN
ncbi:uncharacterized protein LOC116181840 isoform X2 [Photinus pyralis]|uniref:uncharacterized protein LOC116159111 isoform X2 n=1 Tax=Photinus pyralis TaxID=7054 RepID=UPI001266F146|nr:uncharacterized protein LOC116159111 isoform X2 [Photinus pyralis]XP_031358128.1 uncharacterized protein LOC116181840 isoform X2 [Photinus pyralis]